MFSIRRLLELRRVRAQLCSQSADPLSRRRVRTQLYSHSTEPHGYHLVRRPPQANLEAQILWRALVRLLTNFFVPSHWAAQWETTLELPIPGTQLYPMRLPLATCAKAKPKVFLKPSTTPSEFLLPD